MEWMLWTLPTTIFFVVIAALLVVMTVWEFVQPTVERRGRIIPMSTTRGDRLFIALMVAGCLCVVWIVAIPISMWWLLLITVLLVIALLRWG